MGKFRSIIRPLVPDWVVRTLKGGARPLQENPKEPDPPEWEYRERWAHVDRDEAGWNVSSVAEKQLENWPAFLKLLEGAGPFGISHESPAETGRTNLWAHNLIASYGYVLGVAAHRRERISLLDWGGGIGHYYKISKALFPQLEIDYHCEDVPVLCEAGRTVLPGATFFDRPGGSFARSYDFVLAGSSLWYVEEWKEAAAKLAASTGDCLYITRMMFVQEAASFVALQRPWKYGFKTEYQFWILNQTEFVEYVENLGFTFVREFLFGQGPHIERAPEQGFFKGFLFRNNNSARRV